MKLDFSQTASITLNEPIPADFCDRLTDILHREHEMKYECEATDYGYFMKPLFGFTWRKNSFLPEIAVSVLQNGAMTILGLTGRPVKAVRRFVQFYIFFALLLEVLILAIAAFSGLDSIFPVFIPIILCIFGYLLCKITTKITFQTVVNGINKVLR